MLRVGGLSAALRRALFGRVLDTQICAMKTASSRQDAGFSEYI